jgi:hypothetical protein
VPDEIMAETETKGLFINYLEEKQQKFMRMNFSSLDAVDEKTDLSERRLSIYLSAIAFGVVLPY